MEYLPSYRDNLYLAHHGIKGQKWGVRRFETIAGHLTSEGKKRYAKYHDDYVERKNTKKEAKKQARADRADKIKKAITSDQAKTLAKGAAVTAGLIGAGYLGKITMEEIASNKDYKKAKSIGEQLVAQHYGNMSTTAKDAIREGITNTNYQRLLKQRQVKQLSRGQAVKDIANAYINPRRANANARNEFRSKVRSGYYNPDVSKATGLETINSSNFSKYKTGYDNLAERISNPSKFDSKVREERRKAEKDAKKRREEEERRLKEKYGIAYS